MKQSDKNFVNSVIKWRKQDNSKQELQDLIIKMRNAYNQRLLTMTNDEVDAIFR